MAIPRVFQLFLSLLLLLPLAGCELIGGIFKAGFWAAIILIVVVAAVIWGIARLFR